MTGVTGHGGRSSRSGRATSAGSGSSVSGVIRTRTADSKKHVDTKSRSQKPASPRDPKPTQKSAQKLSASSKGESHRELSAIRERPDTAATESELDGEKIPAHGDGDGAESTPRDSGNHSLAGEDPADLRESDNKETDIEHPEYKEADRTESEHRELQRGKTDYSAPEQRRAPEHTEAGEREPEHAEAGERDPEHGEPKYQESEHEKLGGKSESVELGQQELKHGELEHQEPKQQHPERKVTSKPGSRVSTRQEQRSSSKPPSRASSKQSRRASSKEDQRASSKQSHKTPSKEDHIETPKKEERAPSKQRTTLNEEQTAPSKQGKVLTEEERPQSNQEPPLKEGQRAPLKQGTQLKEEQRAPSKQEDESHFVQGQDVHLEPEYLTSHPEPLVDLAGVVEDPGTQNVQYTELEPMSGDMEVLRAAENMSLAAGPETGLPHSMTLGHVIIEKYHEEPQVEDNANPYSGPVEVPPLLTDLEDEPDEPVHIAGKHSKTEPEVVPELKHEQKLDENRNRERAERKTGRGHPKQKEAGPGKESRVSAKAAPHGPVRTETRKQTTNTKQSRKTTKISRSKPVARSHEDLRDLHEGGDSKMATLRLPDDTAALQKSTSLVNIPRNPSALMADLHVYLVPREKWSAPRRLAERTSKQDTISLGFVRVHPDSNLNLLRRDISAQLLGNELALRHYKFVRPVGKHFTQVKAKQESHLKARNFMPPYTSDPEIHLLRLLPHDPLDELEDAAYWRRWDRAFRLDRDYPLVRNTFLNLRKKLANVKQRRAENEQKRDELVILSRSLQEQLSRKKDEDMQKWRDLYLQERKLTGPMEEACSSLRREIDKLHKKLLLRVETRHKGTGKEGPSRKLTMKINCKRLSSDIEDWERRVRSMEKIQETEVKLRKQAERDVKELRQELSQKRVTVTQARSQYGLDAVDWYLLLGRQKAAGRVSRSPSRQAAVTATAATPQPA